MPCSEIIQIISGEGVMIDMVECRQIEALVVNTCSMPLKCCDKCGFAEGSMVFIRNKAKQHLMSLLTGGDLPRWHYRLEVVTCFKQFQTLASKVDQDWMIQGMARYQLAVKPADGGWEPDITRAKLRNVVSVCDDETNHLSISLEAAILEADTKADMVG